MNVGIDFDMINDVIKLGVYSHALEGKRICLDLGMTLKFSPEQLELIRKVVADNKATADALVEELVQDAMLRWQQRKDQHV